MGAKPDSAQLKWYRVAGLDDLGEGRVTTVMAGDKPVALTHFEGKYGALDNVCPHKTGPLGEGSIERGFLRCPWHGWDFHPCTGEPPTPSEHSATAYPVEVREDGIYVAVPPPEPHVQTVADVLVKTMIAWGVDTVFGMVGGSNLGFADAMRREAEAGHLQYIGIRHEGAASFAASAYAKVAGGPAACFSIAGPGATNMMTGLWDAKTDRVPILALTGQIKSDTLGPDAFQEIDIAGAYAAVAEYSQTVAAGSRHAELMAQVIRHAIVRRQVGHLILPDEVQEQEAPNAKVRQPEGRLPKMEIAPSAEVLDAAVKLLRGAKRPVIVVGEGARDHMTAILPLAERLHAPVLTTFKGKGLIPDAHPLATGVLGRSGTPISTWFMNGCDAVLAFGASFSNHTGIESTKKIIQVDLDPMALGRFHSVTIPMVGEIGRTATLLDEALATGKLAATDQRAELAERRAIWEAEKEARGQDDRGHGIALARLFGALSTVAPSDAVIALDVGNNTYSFGRYFVSQRQQIVMSGYLASMGFALPAAMGCWAAVKGKRKVFAICGDGGLAQYLAEITTCVKYKMDITVVVLNDQELGKITRDQRKEEVKVWQTDLVNPNFAEYATSCGAHGIRVTDPSLLEEGLRDAIKHPGPALVEVMTDPELI